MKTLTPSDAFFQEKDKPVKYRYFFVFLLLAFSGNPLISHFTGKFSAVVALIIFFMVVKINFKIGSDFRKLLRQIVMTISVITILQFFVLKFVSVEASMNLCLKIAFGALVIHHLKDQFAKTFFDVIYFLGLISLVFYVFVTLLKVPVPGIILGDQYESYFVYSEIISFESIQNAGMFWEPGAFAGILTLCIVLNFNSLESLFKTQRIKAVVIILTLLTTQSTTGYLVFFVIIAMHLLSRRNLFIRLILVPVFITAGFVVYEGTDFLKSKIEDQFSKSKELSAGEFSNSRFGSFIFDWYYIRKHPIVGNGMHTSTRYADHQFLFRNGEEDRLGNGNSFSYYLASMGVIFVGGYFYLLWKTGKQGGTFFSIVLIIAVLLNLQGEQWFNFPLYLGLPFLIPFTVKKNRPDSIQNSFIHVNS